MGFEFAERLTQEFVAKLDKRDGEWRVRCSGVLDIPNASAVVQPQLLKLHAALVAERIGRVHLDLRDVEYVNSSGLKSFMAWFLAAANTRDGNYAIEVGYDPQRSWQHVSLRPMERLAPKTVKLVPA